ncbi:MAG: D-alanine--D-alanine ligase [Clostridiales bacterium]|nr:D-alanine--D-alanine ligase [Clostridiales bacterium]
MINLAIVFGSLSSEHDVSCVSVSNILKNLNKGKYNVLKIGITKKGEWFLTEADTAHIADGSWKNLETNIPVSLSSSRANRGIIEIGGKGRVFPVDCVWPVLLGKYGEDGTIQGICEMAGIPYVGPGVCASAVSIDKSFTKLIVGTTNVKQADYFLTNLDNYSKSPDSTVNSVEYYFNGKYPLFIKPACEGSSIGVFKVTDRKMLTECLKKAFMFDKKILIEEAILGREVEVAVLGNSYPKASCVGEVLAANDFYDFEAKYENPESKTIIPANISENASNKLREAAITIYKAIECKGLSRVDFFLLENDEIIFNEINTLPGFTDISMYPKLWEATGIPYSALLDKLVELAFASFADSIDT